MKELIKQFLEEKQYHKGQIYKVCPSILLEEFANFVQDEEETKYLGSKEFRNKIRESIRKENFDKNLPIVYMNDVGRIVKEFKDGTIEILE